MSAWTVVASPVGELTLATDGSALTGLWFDGGVRASSQGLLLRPDRRRDDEPLLSRVAEQLREYFAGTRREFDVQVNPEGTQFQKRVWRALQAIPFGVRASYGDVARSLGLLPSASRAVGLANGANPVSIIVPCHRVIGADGSLTGYGGGLDRKQFLLNLESDLLF
jgi:methylated-DNA-[protein]-cysteine S-methyltransferase